MEESYLQLAQTIALLVISLIVLILIIHFMRKFRDRTGNDRENTHSMLSNFREMHSEGGLSDDEFRKIKTDMSTQLGGTVKDTDDSESTD
jgi:uncharacterized membrane protein